MKGVTHLVIDEVHERTLESDFLLIILKKLLPRRPDLKYVSNIPGPFQIYSVNIMSSRLTIWTKLLCSQDYLDECHSRFSTFFRVL